MRPNAIALVCLVVFAARSLADPVDAKALRKAIRPPKMSGECNVAYNSALRGTLIDADRAADFAARISFLEKGITGTFADADRWIQLSELYEDENKRKDAARRALDCARQLVQSNPRSAEFLRLLGEAQEGEGVEDYETSEKTLRQAVALDPRNSACWVSLGMRLQGAMVKPLTGGEEVTANLSEIGAIIKNRLPDAASVAKFRAYEKQATECFDNAVRLAPNSTDARRARATHRMFRSFLAPMLTQARIQKADRPFMASDLFETGYLEDLHAVAALRPDSPRDIAMPMLYEVMHLAAVGKFDQAFADPRNAVGRLRKQMEALAERADPACAGEASYFLGFLEAAPGGNEKKMEAHFRRAEALCPGSRRAETWLDLALMQNDKFDEMKERCEKRLATRNDAKTRYAAAFACWSAKAYAAAETHCREGRKLDPKDVRCRVGLAAMLLRRGDEAGAEEAAKLLRDSQELIQKSDSSLGADAIALWSIYVALSGEVQAARERLGEVLAHDREHDIAVAAMKALSPPR